jgi:MYXO-CTERM domain-containing protein
MGVETDYAKAAMKIKIALLMALLFADQIGFSQGFLNLNFEQSIIVSSSPSGEGFNDGIADVLGWTEYNGWADANYSDYTTLIYNDEPLDSPGVCLEGLDYFRPAIQGNYSIFMRGGSTAFAQVHPDLPIIASIGQTAQIPSYANSITYWASQGLQVSFNGQPLSFTDVSDTANYSVWTADISAYAGQTGQLLFTGEGLLDNIQISPRPVPEPSGFALGALGALLLGFRRRQNSSP